MMMTRRYMAALAALAVGLVATACEEPTRAPVAPAELLELGADNVYYGMVSYLTTSGVREGRIEADTAYAFADSGVVRMRGMELVLYEEDGRARATITAERGELDESSDRMVARGDVVLLVHGDGRRIESPELHYDPNRDRIWSDSATVQTLSGGRVTRGTAFESDLEFRNIRIQNPRGSLGGVGR
jgi:LPS export ABC transporter protein LptC